VEWSRVAEVSAGRQRLSVHFSDVIRISAVSGSRPAAAAAAATATAPGMVDSLIS